MLGNKPVFCKHWYNQGIKYVSDIVGKTGELLLPDQLKAKCNLCTVNFLEYYALRNVIPFSWEKILLTASKNVPVLNKGLDVIIRGVSRDLVYTSNKDIYWSLISTSKVCIIPANYNCAKKYGVPEDNMKKYYQIPFINIRHTKIQSMQYKIIHNFYITNLKLFKWKIIDSSKCTFCDDIDNLEHHFFECRELQVFWNSFCNWWHQFCEKCCNVELLQCRQIILGIAEKVCHKPQLNYLILPFVYFSKQICKNKNFFLRFPF